MFDLHTDKYHTRKNFSASTDKKLLTSTAKGSMCEQFQSAGYIYMVGSNVCCKDCCLAYLNHYFGDVPKYIIINSKDSIFNGTDLINPLPLLWKGDAEEIIDTLNAFGFDVYYSENINDCIIVFPQWWDVPCFNYKDLDKK